jgi:hypothetical protein
MLKLLLLVTSSALVAPAAASAQVAPSAAVSAELQAEHGQWEADHQKWSREHVALARRLRVIAAGIEDGDKGLLRHGSEIDAHGAALARGSDSVTLEKTHARLRSEHEEARIAHHDLIDAAAALEHMARDDEATRTIEDNQREPVAKPRT